MALFVQDVLLDSPPAASRAIADDDATPGVASRPTRRKPSAQPVTSTQPEQSRGPRAMDSLPALTTHSALDESFGSVEEAVARPVRLKSNELRGSPESDVAAAGVSDAVPRHLLPATVAKVFGSDVFTKFSSANWKEREVCMHSNVFMTVSGSVYLLVVLMFSMTLWPMVYMDLWWLSYRLTFRQSLCNRANCRRWRCCTVSLSFDIVLICIAS